jgi:hypothetical protein
MSIIKAPYDYSKSPRPRVFLAGSIEMGAARDWQTEVSEDLLKYCPCTILNPRRDDWDSSWAQDINNKQFNEQVTWELKAIETADIVLMHFEPKTQSPITLLELGLLAYSPYLVVHCPNGFWRKGNVDIVCKHFGIHQVDNLEQLVTKAVLLSTALIHRI